MSEVWQAHECAVSCHDYQTPCTTCGGIGVLNGADPAQFPGCPLSPEFTFEPGPVGIQMAAAREKKAAKERASQIASLRDRMSQKTLAERTGISRSMIAMMESGRALCSAEMLAKIKEAIQC